MKKLMTWLLPVLLVSAMGCGGEQPDAIQATAQAMKPATKHEGTASCFTPWGVDLCALASAHGIDFHAAFVVSPDLGLGGDPLGVGSWWTPMVVWGTNRAGGLLPDFPIAYHDGYVTQFPDDPMRDFFAKLEKFTIVVDPGTHQERVHVYPNPKTLAAVTTWGEFWGPDGGYGLPQLNPMTWATFFPVLKPLRVGEHEMYLSFTMSAEHCDGVPSLAGEPLTFEGGHCIPAGDVWWIPVIHPSFAFQVVPTRRERPRCGVPASP